MYDVNGDGSIEPSEMAEIIRVSSVVFWLLRWDLWLVKVNLGDKSFFKAFSIFKVYRNQPLSTVHCQKLIGLFAANEIRANF